MNQLDKDIRRLRRLRDREIVAELKTSQEPYRAIAAKLGVNESTVKNVARLYRVQRRVEADEKVVDLLEVKDTEGLPANTSDLNSAEVVDSV